MKKKIFSIMMALFLAAPVAMIARDVQEEKSHENVQLRKEVDKKTSKTAAKQAKEAKKEGYKVKPGALPIEKQYDKLYNMKNEYYDDGTDKYFFGPGNATGQTYEAAKQQALMMARQDIAAQIGTSVSALLENNVANNQLTENEAESLTQVMTEGKSMVEQRLGNTINVVEVHREKKNGTIEVQVEVAYSKAQALKMAKSIMRQQLGNEAAVVDKLEW